MNYKKIVGCFLVVIGCAHTIDATDIFKKPQNITIETERLILRLIETDDVKDIFEFTSDPEVEKLTGMFTLHTTYEETEKFIKRHLESYKKQSSIPWVIIYKPHNKVIGIINLFSYIPTHFRAEIGYVSARNYWGKGIATEAATAVLDFGFNVMGLHKIHATVDPRNLSSRHALEKCGFHYEGLLRDHYFLKHLFCDRMVYSMLKSEFLALYAW